MNSSYIYIVQSRNIVDTDAYRLDRVYDALDGNRRRVVGVVGRLVGDFGNVIHDDAGLSGDADVEAGRAGRVAVERRRDADACA